MDFIPNDFVDDTAARMPIVNLNANDQGYLFVW